MKNYEMYDGDNKKGTIKVYWDNINNKNKTSIIETDKDKKYKIVSVDEDGQKYEISLLVNNVDDLYDIVKKYVEDDKKRFEEIDKIKEYNNIKHIKKEETIKVLLPYEYLKYFNKKDSDIDKNSIINSKIYFIKKASEKDKLEEIKKELNIIIEYFNNIINSNEYGFYEEKEKNNFQDKALKELDNIIKKVEETTNYIYGKQFLVNIKVN